jgi:hypothetical protein
MAIRAIVQPKLLARSRSVLQRGEEILIIKKASLTFL